MREATPKNSKIYTISGFGSYLFNGINQGYKERLFEKVPKFLKSFGRKLINNDLKKKIEKEIKSKDLEKIPKNGISPNFFDLGRNVNPDFAVFSGFIFFDLFWRSYMPIIQHLKDKGVKIVFLGAGGKYLKDRVKKYRKFLRFINPYAFVSRDQKCYENYGDIGKNTFNGIDSGFFLKDYINSYSNYSIPSLDLSKYAVLNFDKQSEPDLGISPNLQKVRTHHKSYHAPWSKIPSSHFNKPNTLISDSPYDYAYLYSNAEEVHSDRVHACVATISFGGKCRLYYQTPRSNLFERIGAEEVKKKLIDAPSEKLQSEKERQLEFLRKIFTG